MRFKMLANLLSLLLILAAMPSMASAQRVRWYRGMDSQPVTGPPEVVAAAVLGVKSSHLGLSGIEISQDPRVLRWKTNTVVHFDQEHDGLPVFDRRIVVRIDHQGRVRTVTTNAMPDIFAPTRPRLSEEEALHIAAAAWGAPALSHGEATLGVQPMYGGGVLIWRVDGNLGLFGTRTWVDAITGDVIHHFWRVFNADGRVFAENPVATPVPEILPILHLSGDATSLTGDWVTVYRYVSGALAQTNPSLDNFTLEQTALADSNGDFLYEPTLDASQPDFHDPFAEVSVYYHLDRVYAYFRETHGYSSTRTHVGLANYGDGEERVYANAFFSPVGGNVYLMAMGQAARVDLGYDADVIYHEFGHSVIDNIAQLTYQFDMMDQWGINTGPGGIHEGLADYWAGTLTEDSVMGEYALEGLQAGASRDMSARKICPDDIWGEVHMDGEVFGSAAWAARVALGDSALMDEIMYGALTMQTQRPTFLDFAIAMQDVSQAMVGSGDITQAQYDGMVAALADRGMLACGRDLDLDAGPQRNNIAFNFVLIAQMLSDYGQPVSCEEARTSNMPYINRPFPAIPFNFQLKKNVPASATSVSLRVQHSQSDDLEFYVYARKGQMVRFSEESLFGMITLVEPMDYDHAFGPFDGADETVTIDTLSDPPLEPGEDYYYAVTQKHCTGYMGQAVPTIVTLTGDTDDTPYTPDAGVGQDASLIPDAGTGDDPKKKGCGCAAGASGNPTAPFGLLLLGLLVLGVIRRRA